MASRTSQRHKRTTLARHASNQAKRKHRQRQRRRRTAQALLQTLIAASAAAQLADAIIHALGH